MIREKKSLDFEKLGKTLNDMLKFLLMEAIAGRRARRFCLGAEIPEGVLAFKSKHPPMPLRAIEKLIVVNYGWRNRMALCYYASCKICT